MCKTHRGPVTNVARLFREACRWRAADFLVDAGERFTGAAAERATRVIVADLHRQGVRAGDVVGLLARSSARHALAWFALQRMGAVPVNLHVLETDERLSDTVRWLDAALLIADREFEERAGRIAAGSEIGIRLLSDLPLINPTYDPGLLTLDAAAPDALGAIVLSSGSTGRPKGVMHTQRSLLASALAGSAVYGRIAMADAVPICMGTSFAAWANLVLPFMAGRAKLVFRPRFTPEEFLDLLDAEAISVAPLVPTMWRMVLAACPKGIRLPHLRTAMFSGEPGTRSDIEALRSRLCPRVIGAYLSTEGACASAIVADERDFAHPERADCAGSPIAGAEARIVSPDGGIDAQLPAGTVGEVVLRSASVAKGYWKDEELTRQRFVDGWWRSGDLGVRAADGVIHIKGRLDNMINTGGLKVHAEEIEAALLRHPAVAQAAVVGVPDGTWGQRIEAFVVLARDGPGSAGAILEECRACGDLPPAKLPKRIHVVEALPRSPTGKLYRAGLRAMVEP